jgi:hypothetical protein
MAAMLADDIVTVLAFTAFVVANTYTQAEADAKFVQQSTNYFAGKNFIINGNMNISQRGTSISSVTADTYMIDRFLSRFSNGGTYTLSQESDAPAGFSKSYKSLVTTANASPASGDRAFLVYKNEGNVVQNLAYGSASAKTVTVSFWVKSNVTGTYVLELFNVTGGTNKDIGKTYSISSSGTWEKKSLTFSGDTAQAIVADSAERLSLIWYLMAGSVYTSGTLPSTWSNAVDANRAAGQTANVASAINNYFQITGVQMEIGSIATEFQLSSGTLQGELAAAQRYYYRLVGGQAFSSFAVGNVFDGTRALMQWNLPTTMRVAPTVLDTTGTASNYRVLYGSSSSATSVVPSLDTATTESVLVLATVASGLTAANACILQANNTTTAYLGVSAEL